VVHLCGLDVCHGSQPMMFERVNGRGENGCCGSLRSSSFNRDASRLLWASSSMAKLVFPSLDADQDSGQDDGMHGSEHAIDDQDT
jgi:hypothetical protein